MIRRRSNMEGCMEHLLDRHEYRCTFCPLVCLEIMQIVSPTPSVLPLQHGWEKLEDIQCSQVELKGNLSSLSDKISESSTSHRILYFKSQSIFLDLLPLTLVVKLSSHTKPVTNSVNSGFPHFPGVIPKTTINCHSQKTLAPPTEYPPNLMWPHGGPTQPNFRHLPTLYNNTVD